MKAYIYAASVVILIKVLHTIWKRSIKISFLNKVIWITGASSGIGEELAYQLSKLGATLILSARREDELERVRKGCANPDKVKIFLLDLGKPQEVLEKATKFMSENNTKVDILINNGGVSMRCSFLENDFENDVSMVNINYLSQVALTKAVLPSMLARKNGHVVFMNSIQGKVGVGFRTGYSATKHALTGFADALRAEVEESGVSVTTLYPGYVKTNLSKNAFAGQAGAKYGKTDSNEKSRMDAGVFVDKALRAIYFKERERIVPDSFKSGAAIPLRNVFPNLIFKMVEKKRKKESKETKEKNE